jgi:hypothetical protein
MDSEKTTPETATVETAAVMYSPPPVIGYRTLSQAEVDQMNEIKALGAQVEVRINILMQDPAADVRWVAIAKTQLQQGFMALTRAVAQPTSF